MTKDQIIALEWAVGQLSGSDTPEMLALCDMLEDSKRAYYEYTGQGPLVRWMATHGITIPMKEFDQWRMCLPQDQAMGHISGLLESRGVLRCTNGILCYIERAGRFPYLGHVQHFQYEPTEPQVAKEPKKARKTAVDKMLEEITEFEV
jgi:hypothetical protein